MDCKAKASPSPGRRFLNECSNERLARHIQTIAKTFEFEMDIANLERAAGQVQWRIYLIKLIRKELLPEH